MNIRIECPLCGFHKEVPPSFGGKEVKCPHCETKFSAPFPQVTTLEVAAKPRPKLAGSANGKPAPRQTAPRKSKRGVLVAGLVLALAAGGTAAYFVFFVEGEPENTEATPAIVASKPRVDDRGPDSRLAAEKKAAEDKAARDKAEALAAKQAEEAKARAEKERLQKEADQRALEEKKERERQERLAREEKERKEREAKEEAARIRFEKFNPKLSATPEEVDGDPDKFFGKRLYFDNVRLKGEAIRKPKDLEEYTLGVTSKAGKYYSPIVLGSIFFSADNQLIQSVQKEWDLIDKFPRVRLYCEIRSYEKKPGAKPMPQAHVFKVQIYNSQGSLVKTWEEPDADASAPAKDEGEKKPK